MKLAICLSGHTRTYKHTLESVVDHVIKKFPGTVDVFIHTYNTSGFKPKQGDNTSNESIFLDSNQIVEVLQSYNPKLFLMEDNMQVIKNSQPHFWDKRVRVQPETNVQAVLSMYYSIKKSNELKSIYEAQNNFKYDVVMRLRFDDLIKRQDSFDFSSVQEGFVYVPNIDGLNYNARSHGGWSWRGGLNDQLGFGTSATMDIYSSVYDEILPMYNGGVWFHPETMLKHQITKHKLKPFLVDEIEFELYRGFNS